MAAVTSSAWKTIAVVAAVALVIAMLVAGNLILAVGIVVIALILGGGALLYDRAGPPER
jgi:hypothetical protein